MSSETEDPPSQMRRGWTTGACATAATRAAYLKLLTGRFEDPVTITLPKGETPSFALAIQDHGPNWAEAGIVKDAGDDPDVTHSALIQVKVILQPDGRGVCFRAGTGVGTVTKEGLPIPPGEPAINPVPRQMMAEVIRGLAQDHGVPGNVLIEISVPEGEKLAEKTWNPRLGIVGGISILGTTGIVNPYSCSAWIHAIHRGIDVARAAGINHIAGATGSVSEAAVQTYYNLPESALIDMGDFVGGMLKYLRRHPVARVTIAGGFAKLTKLGQGKLDLHSGRSQVDFEWLAKGIELAGGSRTLISETLTANTASQVLALSTREDIAIADYVAAAARDAAAKVIGDTGISLDVIIVDRKGRIVAKT